MTQHTLQGRTDEEVLWFQRRGFLQAAAFWTASGGFAAAQAQTRSNVVELLGDATVNGKRLVPEQTIQTGDTIATGPSSSLSFVIGTSAFHVRQNSSLLVERGITLNAVSVLRLFSGAVASVWGKGSSRLIVMPTTTAGIRGTGVYSEIFAGQGDRNYFCSCYGAVDLSAGRDKILVTSEHHEAYWGEAQPREGKSLTPAPMLNHTDKEMEYLARLANQRTPWQTSGAKTYP